MTYGEPGYLTEERDSEEGCIRYVYDNHHNLEEKSVLAVGALSWGGDVTTEEDMAGSTGTGKWIRERYSYDRYGRLHYKEDANGNRTRDIMSVSVNTGLQPTGTDKEGRWKQAVLWL